MKSGRKGGVEKYVVDQVDISRTLACKLYLSTIPGSLHDCLWRVSEDFGTIVEKCRMCRNVWKASIPSHPVKAPSHSAGAEDEACQPIVHRAPCCQANAWHNQPKTIRDEGYQSVRYFKNLHPGVTKLESLGSMYERNLTGDSMEIMQRFANQLSTGAKSPLDEVQGVVALWYLLTCFFLVQNLEHLREKLGESTGWENKFSASSDMVFVGNLLFVPRE